jgi:hypothetical protein
MVFSEAQGQLYLYLSFYLYLINRSKLTIYILGVDVAERSGKQEIYNNIGEDPCERNGHGYRSVDGKN